MPKSKTKDRQSVAIPPQSKERRHKRAGQPNVERFLLYTCNRLHPAVAQRAINRLLGRRGKNTSAANKG